MGYGGKYIKHNNYNVPDSIILVYHNHVEIVTAAEY